MVALVPAKSLGLYVVAVAWGGLVSQLSASVGAVLFPRVASQTKPEQQAAAFSQGSRLGVTLVVLFGVPLAALTPLVLPAIFGRGFDDAVPAALILGAAGSLAGTNGILQEGLKGLGRPKAVMWSELMGVACTATLLIFLLRPLGIVGAALASFGGAATVAVYLLRQAQRITGLAFAALVFPNRRELYGLWQRARQFVDEMRRAPQGE